MRWTYWVLVVGLVLAVVAPGGALAGSEPAGPIGGMIWQEINGTCSMDLDEPGLADVNLLLFDDVNNNGMIDEGTDQLVSEVVSEAGGFFTFDGITDGNYLVYLIDMNVPPELVLFYGDNPAQVSLAAGQSDYSTLFGFTGPGVMFSGNDSYTQGNWNGVYGNDAWLLSAGNAPTMNIQHVSQNCDTSAFDFSQSAVNGLKCGVETGLESEQRSLQLPNGEERRASVLFGGGVSNFVIEDLPPDNYMVAVYMVDYDRVGRLQRIRLETMTGYATVIVSSLARVRMPYSAWT